MKLADADPPSDEIVGRIRRWDMAMTKLKTAELLAELPTKRLLMKYTQGFVDRADPPGNLQVNLLPTVSDSEAFEHFDAEITEQPSQDPP